MELIAGRMIAMILLILMVVFMYYAQSQAAKGTVPEIRPIRALDAIEEGVGLAAELGRPVHYSPGTGGYVTETTNRPLDVSAGLDLLGYTSKLVAKYNAEMIVTTRSSEVLAMADSIVRAGYEAAGRPELYKSENMQFFPRLDYWQTAILELLAEKNIATAFWIGPYWGEAVLVAEGGFRAGAFQVAGIMFYSPAPKFYAICDYCMIGEEVFAAAAKGSGDPEKIAHVRAQDLTKIVALALVIVSLIATTGGIKVLQDLLKL
jgi:hypothetical protein